MAMELDTKFEYMNEHDFMIEMILPNNVAWESRTIREDLQIAEKLQAFLVNEFIEILLVSKSLEEKIEAIEKLSEWITPQFRDEIQTLKRIYVHETNQAVKNSVKDLIEALV